MQVDQLWRNARLITLRGDGLGLIEPGLLAAKAGTLVYAGPAAEAPMMEAAETTECDGRFITPGLIDCHTHLVFGGDRAAEWQARLAGVPYAELARTGGIRATVAATAQASEAALVAAARTRLARMVEDGVTTVEVKSGYGLSLEAELRQLRAAAALHRCGLARIVPTLLAAHALPDGMTEDTYLETVALPLIRAAAARNLAHAVDGFLEPIAFSAAAIRRLFSEARAHGLACKLHADQLSDGGGAALAAEFAALSADHLEYAAEPGLAAMARAGTVAVLLPGAYLTLRETHPPPIATMRAHGVRMAVATDCNPGSSPMLSLLSALRLATNLFGLTVPEAFRAVTIHAAAALGLADHMGTLAPGQRADLAIWSIAQPAELIYWIGANPLWRREYAA